MEFDSKNYNSLQVHTVKAKPNSSFKGSKVLVPRDARQQLPFLVADEPIPFWKVIKSFVGQDLTRISMPVILNEP